MSATLDDIESAIFTALATLKASGATPTSSAPLRTLDRWAGEVTADDIDEGYLGVLPGALLAHEGSQAINGPADTDFVETLAHDVEVVERHLFRVYVSVADTRSDAALVKGGTSTPGVYASAQAVKEALAGLRIPGLKAGGVLHLVDHRPWRIRRGESRTDVVRFAAYAALPESTEELQGNPMSRLDASVIEPDPDVDNLAVELVASSTSTT